MKIERIKNVRVLNVFVMVAFLIIMSFSTNTIHSSSSDQKGVSGVNKKAMGHDKYPFGGIGEKLTIQLTAYQNLGDILFKGLKTIVEDKHYKDKVPFGEDARIYAALQMSNIRSKDVIKYQLEHITLHIPKQVITADDDEVKFFPHKYALKSQGWEVIPYIFKHIRKTRSEKEMLLITELFVDICGHQMSKGILEVKKQENPPSVPENKTFNKNIMFMLKQINK